MKTDIEIKDILFRVINGSELHNAVSGGLYKDQRPMNSDREDIVISILDGANGQFQDIFVNVNIYVADVPRGYDMIENTPRLRLLSRLAAELLEEHVADDFQFSIEKQQCLKLNGVNQHCVNNRIYLEITNFKYDE